MVLSLSGCELTNRLGITTSTPDLVNTQEETPTTRTKIIWWGLFETEENLADLINQFEEDNPNFDIEYIQKDENSYLTELNRVLQDGNPNTTPDVFMVRNTAVENYSSFIASAPQSVISIDDFNDEFHEFIGDDFAYNQSIRGIPMWVDTLSLLYNSEHLRETGDTVIASEWNSFQNQAINMTDTENGRYGFAAGDPGNVESFFETMNLLFLQTRQLPLDETQIGLPYSNETEVSDIQDAVSFYRSFETTSKTWDSDLKLDIAMFIEGKLSSVVIPSWRLYDVIAFNESRNLNLQFETTNVPQLNLGEENRVEYADYWGYSVASDSDNVNISWQLLRFLSQKSQQEAYMDKVVESGRPFALISSRKDLQDYTATNSEYLDSYKDTLLYVENWRMVNGEKLKTTYIELLNGDGEVDELESVVDDLRDNVREL